ncbi:rhodanese-like domain-containing protein [SAR86 cluster bacterium]|nr:rhodanese-like domain-containing protein [SAR86 cluster bacterium]
MFHISTFYDCCERDYSFLKQSLSKKADELSIVGTVILTPEGINSTIACANLKNLNSFETYIAKYFPSIDIGRSCTEKKPFKRFKIKERQELVPSGTKLKPTDYAASHIAPEFWNEFSKNKNTILIDVRNNYETSVGTFKGALNPDTRNFREFKHFVKKNKKNFRGKKIGIFCTGGIRCEKASSIFKSEDINDVHQLKGGILSYLANSKDKKLWEGECFVFDERVTVDKDLNKGSFYQCFACRRPLSEKDLESTHYSEGVSCHQCINEKSEEDRLRYLERHKQIIKKRN